jgi:hypothetical protein
MIPTVVKCRSCGTYLEEGVDYISIDGCCEVCEENLKDEKEAEDEDNSTLS